MKQTELMNMQDIISFEGYDRWVSEQVFHENDTTAPMLNYIERLCEDNGYEPTRGDMTEMLGELTFCIEQYSTLLYTYYTHAGVTSVAEADAVHIMATMNEDMNNDLAMI